MLPFKADTCHGGAFFIMVIGLALVVGTVAAHSVESSAGIFLHAALIQALLTEVSAIN